MKIMRIMKQRHTLKTEKAARKCMLAAAVMTVVAFSMAVLVPLTSFVSLAEQTPEDAPVVLENEDGGEVVIDVEEELPADSDELKQQEEDAGIVSVEEEEVPLAGFSEVQSEQDDGNIHIIWMILLLAAALGYIGYFTFYQNRLFDLRRRIADAEYEVRKDGNRK